MQTKTTVNKEWMSKEDYINYLASRSNEINLSHNNSKTGPCCNNLAFPTCTCRPDAPCKASGCYCMKGRQAMSNVVAAYMRNLRIYNQNSVDFWNQVVFKIEHCPLPLFRWFDAGDIPDYEFFIGMVDLAKRFPNIDFMSFTKKYDIVNTWIDINGDLPNNLNVMFSAWHIGWYVPNPHNLPIAYVDFKDKTMNPVFPEEYTICPNQIDKTITCSTCRKCWNKRIKAVVFKQH